MAHESGERTLIGFERRGGERGRRICGAAVLVGQVRILVGASFIHSGM
jgi:hypothetical protein